MWPERWGSIRRERSHQGRVNGKTLPARAARMNGKKGVARDERKSEPDGQPPRCAEAGQSPTTAAAEIGWLEIRARNSEEE